MVSATIVAAKLAELADRATRVRAHRRATAAALEADRDALDLVAFNLMLCVQICADVAAHIVSDEGWAPAKSLAESFVRLHEHGVIDQATAKALARAVGLPNVVAHGYAGADAAMLHTASHDGLDDLDAFARQVAAWVSSRTGPTTGA